MQYDFIHFPQENPDVEPKHVLVKPNGEKVEVTKENAISVIDSILFELIEQRSMECMLSHLPECIKVFDEKLETEFEDEKYHHYHFGIFKDNKKDSLYELSYFDCLWEKELISFTGSLREVAEKMYEWCKAMDIYRTNSFTLVRERGGEIHPILLSCKEKCI